MGPYSFDNSKVGRSHFTQADQSFDKPFKILAYAIAFDPHRVNKVTQLRDFDAKVSNYALMS